MTPSCPAELKRIKRTWKPTKYKLQGPNLRCHVTKRSCPTPRSTHGILAIRKIPTTAKNVPVKAANRDTVATIA